MWSCSLFSPLNADKTCRPLSSSSRNHGLGRWSRTSAQWSPQTTEESEGPRSDNPDDTAIDLVSRPLAVHVFFVVIFFMSCHRRSSFVMMPSAYVGLEEGCASDVDKASVGSFGLYMMMVPAATTGRNLDTMSSVPFSRLPFMYCMPGTGWGSPPRHTGGRYRRPARCRHA